MTAAILTAALVIIVAGVCVCCAIACPPPRQPRASRVGWCGDRVRR